jgi:POT family proton-dependent oligopeptide transporter
VYSLRLFCGLKILLSFTYLIRSSLGHIILVASATPASLQHPDTALGLLILAIFVMAVGAG